MRQNEGSVRSADGTAIGFVTQGSGPPLLIVHGGMRSITAWQPLLRALVPAHEVTAMDRRGRGRSPDAGTAYSLEAEARDVAAVASFLAERHGGPVDVFGHSYGALAVLAAAGEGAPLRRLALYEPPGPETVLPASRPRIPRLITNGEIGRAVVLFLTEVIHMPREQVFAMRDTPQAADALTIAASTFIREGNAIATANIPALAAAVTQPALLLLGERSPAWAQNVTSQLQGALPLSTLSALPGQGHDAVDDAPATVAQLLVDWFTQDTLTNPAMASGHQASGAPVGT